MAKRAAFFIPYFWTPHLETDLELIHQHVSSGDEVTLYICTSELSTCFSNTSRDLSVCQLCSDRRRTALNLTGLADKVRIQNFVNLSAEDRLVLERYRGIRVDSVEQLYSIELENCPIGKNIYNELVCIGNESEPDMVQAADYVTRCIESSALVYLSFRNNLSDLKPDIFYTFNGRFVVSQPAVAAAQATNTHYALHDRAGMMNRFWMVKDHNFHSMKYWTSAVQSHWQSSNDTEERKLELGRQWFDARANNQKLAWFSFTAEQSVELPASFNRQNTNIVIFNSSESEFAGMDDYRLRFHETQNEGIERIAEALANDSGIRIYLRVHPNLKGKDNAQTRFIKNKLNGRFPNFEVIPAEAPIKTYALMKSADVAIVFGSTAGVEAVYHGTPTILLGHGWYEGLDACLIPSSHDDLIDMLRTGRFRMTEEECRRRSDNAVKYGYFCQTSGTPFRLFEQTDIFEMRYRGKEAYDATITNTALPYAQGLKRELAQRNELTDDCAPNAMAATVRELESVADSFAAENERLQGEVETLRAALAASANRPRLRTRIKHRLSHIRNSLGRSVRRMLPP